MKVTLVRHGEVEERYHRCYNGHLDMGLSARGHEEARCIAEYMRATVLDAVYCSDLLRARQTLVPFALGVEPRFTDALREKSWGRHEGMTFDEIIAEAGMEYRSFEQWINALDGEAYGAYIERIRRFFTQTLPQTGEENVLVVSHAGVIRVLMHIVEGITLEEAFSIGFPYGAFVELEIPQWRFGEVQCVS